MRGPCCSSRGGSCCSSSWMKLPSWGCACRAQWGWAWCSGLVKLGEVNQCGRLWEKMPSLGCLQSRKGMPPLFSTVTDGQTITLPVSLVFVRSLPLSSLCLSFLPVQWHRTLVLCQVQLNFKTPYFKDPRLRGPSFILWDRISLHPIGCRCIPEDSHATASWFKVCGKSQHTAGGRVCCPLQVSLFLYS